MIQTHIGLGSNLDNPYQHITQAFSALGQLKGSELTACSPIYRSKAVGPKQPDYLNAVCALKTSLSAIDLLDMLQAIERHHKRERNVHWGPRTLDLDLLTYGDQVINEPRLQVPHPYLAERSFVVLPLYDVSPHLVLPNGVSLASLWAQCDKSDITPYLP